MITSKMTRLEDDMDYDRHDGQWDDSGMYRTVIDRGRKMSCDYENDDKVEGQ